MQALSAIKTQQTKTIDKTRHLESFIGKTPLYPIENMHKNKRVKIYAKLEWQQFGGSVKARPAFNIIRDALNKGKLSGDKHLLDASSGNTGIAYAHVGAALDIPVTLCLPENATEERKRILKSLGADLRLTSRTGGTDEAQLVAQTMYDEQPHKYYYADQYSNPANWKAHYNTTGVEILNQTDHKITHFIAGLGTTGTFTGTTLRLKEFNENIESVALHPDIAMHGLEGWKHLETARTPAIYNASIADENRRINTEKSYEIIEQAAHQEGLLISPSSAANLAGAIALAEELDEGVVVTVFPDDGSKYAEVYNQLF